MAQDHEGEGNNATAPRTAVGFSADGRRMHVITVDGRQADSGGVTLTELGLMMQKAGAHNALNLDGGGSSTLVAREPGSDALLVENSPSDGSERTVPNGLALTVPDGSGRLRGFWVETATPAATAPTGDPVLGGHPDRVFPGLTRRLTAAGFDETYGPAAGPAGTPGPPPSGGSTATASSTPAAPAPPRPSPSAAPPAAPSACPCSANSTGSNRPCAVSRSATPPPPAPSASSATTPRATARPWSPGTSPSTTTAPCSTSAPTGAAPSPSSPAPAGAVPGRSPCGPAARPPSSV
ncbi:phosphodiester glycosidase family protein [Streptomyces zhihengii]